MTEPALVLAPVACCLVLAVSGVAKLGDLDALHAAFITLGVPRPLRSPLTVRSLPLVEVALAALLVLTWGWVLAAVAGATTLLFVVYWLIVARVLRDGETVDCRCFGSLGSDEVTSWTLARNTVLVLLAALATAFGVGGSGVVRIVPDLQRSDWSWLAMSILVALAAVLVVAPTRASEPGPTDELLDYERSPIPFGLLEDEDGKQITLRDLASGQAQLLVFMSVGCGACVVVGQKLKGWSDQLDPVAVSAVFTQRLDTLPEDYELPGVRRWFDVASGVTGTFCHAGRPAAVLLGADGQLAGGPVNGTHQVTEFVDDIFAELGRVQDASLPDQADAPA